MLFLTRPLALAATAVVLISLSSCCALLGLGCKSTLDPRLLSPFPERAQLVAGQVGILPGAKIGPGGPEIVPAMIEVRNIPGALGNTPLSPVTVATGNKVTVIQQDGLAEFQQIANRSGEGSIGATLAKHIGMVLGFSGDRFLSVSLVGVVSQHVASIADFDAVAGTYVWTVWYATEAKLTLDDSICAEVNLKSKELGQLGFDHENGVLTIAKGRSIPIAYQTLRVETDTVTRSVNRRIVSGDVDLTLGYRIRINPNGPGDVLAEIYHPLTNSINAFEGHVGRGWNLSVHYAPGKLAEHAIVDRLSCSQSHDGILAITVTRTNVRWGLGDDR